MHRWYGPVLTMPDDDLELFLEGAPLFSSADRADLIARRAALRHEPTRALTSGASDMHAGAAGAATGAMSRVGGDMQSTRRRDDGDAMTTTEVSAEDVMVAEGQLSDLFSSMDPFSRRRGSPAHASPASSVGARSRLNSAHARIRRVQQEAAATVTSPQQTPAATVASSQQTPAARNASDRGAWTPTAASSANMHARAASEMGPDAVFTPPRTAATDPFVRVKMADTSSLFGSLGSPMSTGGSPSRRRGGGGGASLARSPVNDAARHRLQKLRALQAHNGGVGGAGAGVGAGCSTGSALR